MAYGKPSSFLDQAKARGVPTSEGFGMLVGQAIESLYIWNGIKPDLKEFLEKPYLSNEFSSGCNCNPLLSSYYFL